MAVKVLAKRGTAAQIEGAASSVQTAGEIAFATDTKDFYVSDGTQFNKIGKDQLSQFGEISVVNEVSSWHLSTTNILDLNPPEANPTGITFKPDGTRMFTLGYSRNRVQQYDLSTAWDLTSAGSPTESEYLVQNNLSSTQEDFFIDSSGTRMYVVSRSSDSIGQFTLNTAWDISDITFVQDLHINSTSLSGGVTGVVTGEPDPSGLTFKPDGTILYLVGYNQDKVHQIPLSTAWDISTHGTITELSISPANASQSIQFSSDGKEMYILDYSLDGIAHFTLSTAWDVTTANLTTQSIAFIRVDEGTPTGLYYRDDLGKCFIVGRSGDFAREVIANDIYSFNEGITAPVVYSPQINADRLSTGGGGGGSNNFYNATYARTTFQSSSTTYLGYETSSPLIRLGNSVLSNTRIQVSRFTYLGADIISNPLSVPRFQFFPSLVGAKSKVQFGKFEEDTAVLIGGTMDIESEADTFDHKGEITLGGELKVAGDKPLAYKDPNLYTQGTQIVLDNFNETTQTTLDNHTPDTGSGYTNVYISSGISFPTHLPIIEANNGFLRPALNNSNDGYRFVNDTTISTNNYEARAVIKRQHGGDDPFVLFVKYIDENNYFAISFGNNYVYCSPISVVNGVYSTHGYLYYYANTSTADNENIEVAVRVVGNNVHVFYEGVYRGSREINITGAGKAGIGFGKMNNSQYTSYDIGINNHISKFEVYELPDSLFDGSDSVHYIENGKLGIGTTSPAYKLHVNGTARFEDAITLSDDVNNRIDADATGLLFKSAAHYTFTKGANTLMFIKETGNVGIGTTSPQQLLDITDTDAAPVLRLSRNQNIGGTSWAGESLGDIEFYTNDPSSPNVFGKISVIGGPNSGTPNVGYPDGHMVFYTRGQQGGNTLSERLRITDEGNVGIGTTNPTQKLQVQGSQVKFTSTTSGENRFMFSSGDDGNNSAFYMYNSVQTNTILFNSGGNSYFNGGNVGIGTTSPQAKLDVQGSKIHLGTGGSNSNRAFFIANTTTNTFEFNNSVGDRGIRILTNSGLVSGAAASRLYGAAGGVLLEGANGQENIALTTDGKVGIGTTSPYATLTVAGNITQTGNSYLISTRKITARDAAGLALYNDGGKGIDIKDNNGDVVIADGNVGIGTTNLSYKFNVNSGNAETVGFFKSTDSRARILISDDDTNTYVGSENGYGFFGGQASLSTANLVINSTNGNVGIGTTSPSEKLEIGTDGGGENKLRINSDVATKYLQFESLGNLSRIKATNAQNLLLESTGAGGYITFNANGAERMRVLYDGKVGIGTTSPAAKLDVEGLVIARNNGFQLRGTSPSTTAYSVIEQNGTEGVFRLYNGSNWGFIARGVGNNPYIGAYQNGSLRIRGFGQSDGGDNAADKDLAIFDFANERVGIGTPNPTEKLHVVGKGVFESIDIFKIDTTANPRLRVGRYNAETLNFDVDDMVARIYHKQDETDSSVHKLNLTVDSDSTGGSEINLGFRDNDGSNESTKLAILSSGNVGIGTTSPHATALLEVASTTKGVLFPRMTSAQRTAISSPATGLIVYQTDATEGLYIYKSTGWVQII